MAYFARKLRYGAHDGEEESQYLALIELARRKGGKPVGFILYFRCIRHGCSAEHQTKMIRFKAETAEEAITRFWPWDEGTGKEFPGWESSRWEWTTLWLNRIAAGGWFEGFGYRNEDGKVRFGTWVKVGMPASWRSRRRKRPLQFGNLAHLILVLRARVRGFEDQKMRLDWSLSDLEAYDEKDDCLYVPKRNEVAYIEVRRQIAKIEREIDSVHADIANKKAEMRYKVHRMFPPPAGTTSKRITRRMMETVLQSPASK